MPFTETEQLRNPLNEDKPVKISRDGQELPPDLGEALVQLFEEGAERNGIPRPGLCSLIMSLLLVWLYSMHHGDSCLAWLFMTVFHTSLTLMPDTFILVTDAHASPVPKRSLFCYG